MKKQQTTSQKIEEADNSPDLLKEVFSAVVLVMVILLIIQLSYRQ